MWTGGEGREVGGNTETDFSVYFSAPNNYMCVNDFKKFDFFDKKLDFFDKKLDFYDFIVKFIFVFKISYKIKKHYVLIS